jgi:MYXO-CTERM domain-containing protein
VSFWLDLYSQGAPSAPSPTITVTLGDQTLAVSLSVTNTQAVNYRQFQFLNVTTATAAELKFDTVGSLSQTQYVNFLVDDVVVTSVVSAVPEPSALALGLTGLAGLALWRRRSLRQA